MKVAVIGAGPSGLVTLKYLREAQEALNLNDSVEVQCFESEKSIGGTFSARVYEDAQLVSSKQLTAFADLAVKEDEGDFLAVERYLKYLCEYCDHFKLWPHIRFQTKVLSISPKENGGHIITYSVNNTAGPQSWECDAIAICSGLHVYPNFPIIPGLEKIPTVMHSSDFRAREQLGKDKTVLVIGSGETGADVTHLAVTSPARRVVWSHRDGFHFAPQRNLNPAILPSLGGKSRKEPTIPLDHGRASLFDTAYVHPILRDNDTLLWSFYDYYVKSVIWATTGTTAGFDQWIGEISPERRHVSKIFFNKTGGKVNPFVSAPYRPRTPSLINRLRSSIIQAPIADNHGRTVDLAPLPEYIDQNGIVHFHNTSRPESSRMKDSKIKPDIAILCTGYKPHFPFLESSFPAPTSPHCYPPYSPSTTVRQIWHPDHPSLAFIGFVRPSLGAIPPLAEMQAQLWILHLLAPERIVHPLTTADERHYRLRQAESARIQYGVDHESYVYQLALDMGSAMGFGEVLQLSWRRGWKGKGWRFVLCWALSANLNAKFRVVGPWRWDGAEERMVGQMWDSVRRRRIFWDHFLLSILPMAIFGPLSLLCWVYATVVGAVMGQRRVYGLGVGSGKS